MGLLMDALGSQAGGFITNLLGGIRNRRDWRRFINQTNEDYNKPLQDEFNRLGGGSDYRPVDEASALSAAGIKAGNEAYAPVVPAYQDLYRAAQGIVGDMSQQALTDVNSRYDALGAANEANLRARGLSGSTLSASAAYGNEAARTADLNRTRDYMIQPQLGVLGTFGAAVPQAQFNVADAQMGNLYNFGTYPINTSLQAAGLGQNAFTSQYLFPPPGFNPINTMPYGGYMRPS